MWHMASDAAGKKQFNLFEAFTMSFGPNTVTTRLAVCVWILAHAQIIHRPNNLPTSGWSFSHFCCPERIVRTRWRRVTVYAGSLIAAIICFH